MEKPNHGIEIKLDEGVRNEKQRYVLTIIAHCVTRPRHVIVPVIASSRNYDQNYNFLDFFFIKVHSLWQELYKTCQTFGT